jgi:hypothetical protein
MTPIDFVTDLAEDYNAPVGKIVEALKKPLRVVGDDGEYEVLSYYLDLKSGCMVLDIKKVRR